MFDKSFNNQSFWYSDNIITLNVRGSRFMRGTFYFDKQNFVTNEPQYT